MLPDHPAEFSPDSDLPDYEIRRRAAHADIDLMADNAKAMALRLERIDAEIKRAGLAALVASREFQHEFECLAIEHRAASVMVERYREHLKDDHPVEFCGFRGSSMSAAVMIAAECRLRAFRELLEIEAAKRRRDAAKP